MSGQQEIRDLYIIDTSFKNLIGQGAFGSVYKCKRKDGSDNDSLCIKIIKKERNQMKQLKQEIEIQKLIMNLKTEKLLRTENIINTPHYFEVVMERCDMDLEQEFKNLYKQQKWYDLNDCLNIINQISVGCRILYEHNIVHRDIKPSNILVKLENKGQINERKLYKISDFDFSRILVDFCEPNTITNVGTTCYFSPQIYKQQKYSGKCDIFSYGILFYQIFFNGKFPFNFPPRKEDIQLFMKKLQEKQFKCELPNYPRAEEIADLLQKMIVYEEDERISFDQFFLHPIINLEEYEINKILTVQFRKYLLYNSICQKYQNQDQILILVAVFCLQLLGNQELLYCMGFIHITISDIPISYKQNKDITTIMRILQQCAQNINIYPQYQQQINKIKQAYFQIKKTIFNLKEQFRKALMMNQDNNKFITEISNMLEQSQYQRIQPQKIFDQLKSLLNQKLQEDLKADITKVLYYQENIPFEKYKEINPDDIFEEQNKIISTINNQFI